MALFVGISSAYIKLMLGGTSPAHNFSTPVSLFTFFVYVALINVGLGLVSRRLVLARAELAVVFIMAMVAAALPTIGFTSYVLPIITGVFYYATPENDWANLIHPHLPRWMVVDDYRAVKLFYEGPAPRWVHTLGGLAGAAVLLGLVHHRAVLGLPVYDGHPAQAVDGTGKVDLPVGPGAPGDDPG